ncbi:tRNA uridine-5-carboxymethylaminomethyl(34) synthesis GTPase MnmE [Intestinibacillus massiliensis]|nr:tRNA uridine-5-carboxymethylaminomethyl(34) synthesis GTPase MnmE [Intestinibacillus massiliensis]
MSDTIAAVATAPGGPIGIIRVSGDGAARAVSAVFQPKNGGSLVDAPPHKLVYGTLHSRKGAVLDCCLAAWMRAPHSYTGEDMAEIQCHGSPAVLGEALAALFANGARQAGPGEFTKRAFINGKMDLSGAEAVQELVTAQTAQAAQNASAQIAGKVGGTVQALRDSLVEMVAHFHAVVDFPDEDIDPFLFEQAQEILHRAAGTLYSLAESYERGRVIRDGVPCVILGRPNAGKSSLLNALLGCERAIVTDQPGTTRDVIEETVRVGPVLLRMLDTAGLRDTDDPVEKIGIERALATANGAAMILAVFDGSDMLSDEDLMVIARSHGRRAIAVINKSDLPDALDLAKIRRHFDHIVSVSAKTGEGMDALTKLIPSMVGLDGAVFDGSIITSARQAAALARAAERCEEALFAAQSGMTPDAVVMDAEGAIAALGEVTGQNVTEDVISKIFENFCVGK